MRRASRLVQDTSIPESVAKDANWLNIATFWYAIKIFKIGLKRDFQDSDLTQPLEAHKSAVLGDKLARLWSKEIDLCISNDRKPSLFKVIVKCFGWEVVKYGFLLLVMELGVRIFQPLFIGLIIRSFSISNLHNNSTLKSPKYLNRIHHYFNKAQPKIQQDEAMIYALGVVLCSLMSVLVIHPVFALLTLLGMKNRIAVCSLIYRKALRLSITELGGSTVGNVINLLSNDVNRFDAASQFCHYLWIGPATLIIATYYLYQRIKSAAFIGAIPVIIVIPLQMILGYCTAKLRLKTAARTDNRVRIMNEIIQGIQVIKMYAWEYAFSGMVRKARKSEMSCLIKASCIRGTFMSFILFTGRMSMFLAVLATLKQNAGGATNETIFLIVAYYQIMRLTMTIYFPQGVANLAELTVSIKRIEDFLLMPEAKTANPEPLDPLWLTRVHKIQNYRSYYDKHAAAHHSEGVYINKASLRYGRNIVLKNMNLKVQPGQLTVVIGEVGSGKSCILQMVLGEMFPFKGSVEADGVVSYASQDPWLFAGTVRQNILFGEDYDRRRYNDVIKACALSRDFSLLPYGDRTIVGERGISLSGGQRARVNLARAVYKDADIYLLDDPLSAVDPNVGKQLFDDCITGYLRDKCVILCTHQLQYLKNVPQIMVLHEGNMEFVGSYQELTNSGIDFAKLLDEVDIVDLNEPGEDKIKTIMKSISIKKVPSVVKEVVPKDVQEQRSAGAMGIEVIKGYFRAGGNTFFILIIFFLFIMSQISASAQDFFFSIWAKIENKHYYKRELPADVHHINFSRPQCILISSCLIASTTVFALVRSYYFYSFCMRSSIGLHRKMFDSICHGHMRFFNTNPSGRILNRFSKDMGAVDELLPNAMCDTYQILLNLLGTAFIFMYINYYLILPTVAILIIFYFTRKYYLRCGRSIKRLEGVARSPVFSHVNASLQGLATIRSHSCEMMLVEEFDYFQDVHTSSWFMFIGTSRAFGYVLDLLVVLYSTIITFIFVGLGIGGGATIALAITQCMGLTGAFQWGMRQSAELENQMTAVERLLEYTVIEHEPPLESKPDMKPPLSWPKIGQVDFQKVFLRYCLTEDPVLKNINLSILPKEKIGIVGRTGAGKSTIISALFRLAYIDGLITIDGIETGGIGLHDLRRTISIIPQEPVIFSGTLRYNLDPFQQYSDDHLWKAILDVDLKIAGHKDCLNEIMSEGGSNLSVGSKQLVCLARAIVRNNKILILDEATANVDGATDNFIQAAIRDKFASCTVLTIAHRLNTIMDSDRVLVIDAGMISEFDHPYILLQNKNGIFTQLVEKTGPQSADKLFKLAKLSYEKKREKSPKTRKSNNEAPEQ